MQVVRGLNALRTTLKSSVDQGRTIGFVATMGALHEGHMVLVEQAKKETQVVVTTIFVNPTQFNESSDFEKYPRTEARDTELLQEAGCDIVYIPKQEEVYPPNKPKLVEYDDPVLFGKYEGTYRPGHFQGVVTVVIRLFDHILPTYAYFGLKDYQQYLVIKRASDYLRRPVGVVGVPTQRAQCGLALSSRNFRLSDEEKEKASVIYSVLNEIGAAPSSETTDAQIQNGIKRIEAAGLRIDYLDVCDLPELNSVSDWRAGQEYIAVCAAFMGEVRLIDNLVFTKML